MLVAGLLNPHQERTQYNMSRTCEIWVPHDGSSEDCRLLRYDTVQSGKNLLMCDLRLQPGLPLVVITFGLLPSVAFLSFVTNVSGPYINTIFRVQRQPLTGPWRWDGHTLPKRWSRTKEKRRLVTSQSYNYKTLRNLEVPSKSTPFYTEGEVSRFCRNVGKFLPDNVASRFGRQQSSSPRHPPSRRHGNSITLSCALGVDDRVSDPRRYQIIFFLFGTTQCPFQRISQFLSLDKCSHCLVFIVEF
jgi:hypothetical protein